MTRMQKQAERFGARVEFGTLESASLTGPTLELVVDGTPAKTETLIIASGASHRHLGLESEHLLENKGVTYCATCDGALPIFRNQPLVVVGGGDSACEEALYLTRFASVVHLIHRRDTLRASRIMAERTLAHPKIKPVWDSVVTAVMDVQQDKVTGVLIENVKTGAASHISCAGVFVAIGHVPNTQIFKVSSTWMSRATSCRPAGRQPISREFLSPATARIVFTARRSPLLGWVAPPPSRWNATSPRRTPD